MPREIGRKPRMIYPQIATSLSIASVSALAELLFWRILPQADDQGRLTGDPRQLKAIACPMREELTTDNIPELLSELKRGELIICYSNSSTAYIQITKWWDYQSGMRRVFPSKYPPPEGWRERVRGVSGELEKGSDGQTPTIAPLVPPKPESVVTRKNNQNTKPEPEVEAGKKAKETSATPAAETAEVSNLLRFVETLEGWRFEKSDDLAWLREFCRDWTDFNLKLAKACRDWHSGKVRAKHKGVWKSRFRHWMEREREHGEKEKSSAEKKEKPIEGLRIER